MNLFKRLSTRLAIWRLARRAKRLARDHGVPASVLWLGAYHLHPKHLAVIVRVARDNQKEQLLENAAFMSALRAAPAAVGYPEEGRNGVAFDVESQETVDRLYKGNWYYRLK